MFILFWGTGLTTGVPQHKVQSCLQDHGEQFSRPCFYLSFSPFFSFEMHGTRAPLTSWLLKKSRGEEPASPQDVCCPPCVHALKGLAYLSQWSDIDRIPMLDRCSREITLKIEKRKLLIINTCDLTKIVIMIRKEQKWILHSSINVDHPTNEFKYSSSCLNT